MSEVRYVGGGLGCISSGFHKKASRLWSPIGLLVVTLTILALATSCTNKSSYTYAVSSAENFAKAGKTVFTDQCAKCHDVKHDEHSSHSHSHGNNNTHVHAILGVDAALEKYSTAQELFDYISATMPFDAPGSLSREQYLKVLVFLLVENGFISSEKEFDADHLELIRLKK